MTGQKFEPRTFTLLGSVAQLSGEGQWGLAALILACSVLFPLAKYSVLALETLELIPAESFVGHWLHRLGKWSMLDVLVLAVVVVAFKSFPGGTRIELCWGTWMFGLAVIAGMAAGAIRQE